MKATLEKIQSYFKKKSKPDSQSLQKFDEVEKVFMKMDSTKTIKLDWRSSFLRQKSSQSVLNRKNASNRNTRREGRNEVSAN